METAAEMAVEYPEPTGVREMVAITNKNFCVCENIIEGGGVKKKDRHMHCYAVGKALWIDVCWRCGVTVLRGPSEHDGVMSEVVLRRGIKKQGELFD